MVTPLALALVLQTLQPPPVPLENPIKANKAMLGKVLFWDEQLSSTDSVACGTCHFPSAGGIDPRSSVDPAHVNVGPDGLFGTADDRVASAGIASTSMDGFSLFHAVHGLDPQVTSRRSFPMINSAYFARLNWDGSVGPTFVDPESGLTISSTGAALEEQSLRPILSQIEMGHAGRTWADVRSKLERVEPLRLAENVPADMAAFVAGRTYPELFELAFVGEVNADHVDARRIAQAIATYERTLISDETPYDEFLAGNPSALTPEEDAGRILFEGSANCIFCHPAPNLSDFSFQNTGVRPTTEDPGLQLVTGSPFDAGRFRTTQLRNVELRPRFFHNGQFGTLEEVVDFYDRGGDFTVNQSNLVVPLGLTDIEKSQLLAFLSGALTDPRVAGELPPFDRPMLFTESNRVPVLVGAPTPGTAGAEPRAVCVEPPLIGNPEFTLGVEHGTASLPTFLAYDTSPSPTPGGTPFFGALVHLALGSASVVTFEGTLEDSGQGDGWLALSVPLPSDPLLAGTNFFAQWFILDPGAAQGLAASSAIHVTLF